MLFTALSYSWYADKNRQTPPELFETPDNASLQKYGAYVVVLSLIIELVFLFYAIPIAFRVARTNSELIVHLMFVILATPLYLFVYVASQLWTVASAGVPI